jgi:hypothetical protein
MPNSVNRNRVEQGRWILDVSVEHHSTWNPRLLRQSGQNPNQNRVRLLINEGKRTNNKPAPVSLDLFGVQDNSTSNVGRRELSFVSLKALERDGYSLDPEVYRTGGEEFRILDYHERPKVRVWKSTMSHHGSTFPCLEFRVMQYNTL